MNMVYDLLLNLQEEDLEFFEWQMEDEIEHIKKIPMFRVTKNTLEEIFTKQITVDQDFLLSIYEKCEKYNLETLAYAALFTDGEAAFVIEFNEKGENLFFSHLLPTDEEEITRYAKSEEVYNLSYHIKAERKAFSFFTREEKKVKNFLEHEIIASFKRKEFSKLRYLYLEYFEKTCDNIEEGKEELLTSIQTHLTKKHFALYEVLKMAQEKKVL